jgi:hypothetical protein
MQVVVTTYFPTFLLRTDMFKNVTNTLGFYISIKTITVRNENVGEYVVVHKTYSEIRYQDVQITFEFLRQHQEHIRT